MAEGEGYWVDSWTSSNTRNSISTAVLWYVDGQHEKLKSRYCAIPHLLSLFPVYYKPAEHHHSLPRLSRDVLESYPRQLEQVSMQLWLQEHAFKDLHTAVLACATALKK